jgi:hypothetical protein
MLEHIAHQYQFQQILDFFLLLSNDYCFYSSKFLDINKFNSIIIFKKNLINIVYFYKKKYILFKFILKIIF